MLTKLSCRTSSAQSSRLKIRIATPYSFAEVRRYSSAKARWSRSAQRAISSAIASLSATRCGCWFGRVQRSAGAERIAAFAPQHVGVAVAAVDHPAQHKQEVGQSVEVLNPIRAELLAGCGRNEAALGASAYGARDMAERRSAAAAGQDEVLERRQLRVVLVEQPLQPRDVRRCDALVAGNGELAAQLEQVVLNADQRIAQ